jgi:penicillin-binding protein 2
MSRRLNLVRLVLLGAAGIIALRLGQLQVVQGALFRQASEQNRIRLVLRAAPRGPILDRAGRLLAGSRPAAAIEVTPTEFARGGPEALERLARILGPDADTLADQLDPRRVKPYRPIVVLTDAPEEIVAKVEEQSLYLPGVAVVVAPVRSYRGSVAAHVIGYVREVDRADLAARAAEGYRQGDRIGKFGLEKMLESTLRGRAGGDQIEVDASGRRLRTLSGVPPVPGQPVRTTLDLSLQLAAEEGLGDRAGAVVALDPRTGEILALVSHPAFDPNKLSHTLSPAEWRALNSPERPQLNRATTGLYEPGSVFKLVTLAAALEGGETHPGDNFYCPGFFRLGGWTLRCWRTGGHGPLDLRAALVNSCNTVFATLGYRLGADALLAMARRFGFGRPTGFDLGEERAGHIPGHRAWQPGDPCQFAIGQGSLLVTPLQVARAVAAIANGGTLVRPHILLGGSAAPQPLGVSARTLEFIRDAMAGVVAEGTARGIKSEEVTLAGKTGTAENPGGSAHAWFAGFGPVEAPRVVVVVLIQHGGTGSGAAAPVAARVFAAAFGPSRQDRDGVPGETPR